MLKFNKFIIVTIIFVLSNNITKCPISEKELAVLTFTDPEGTIVKGSDLLTSEIVFKDRKEAEDYGFKFAPRFSLTKGQLVIAQRSGGGYSFAIVEGPADHVYYVQDSKVDKTSDIKLIGICEKCSFKKILAKKIETEEKKKKEE